MQLQKLKQRYYCDFNASTPLSPSVIDWLAKGDIPYANPSSLHSSAQSVRRKINTIRQFFLDSFSLNDSHILFFHSGATEGINTIIQGLAKNATKNKQIFYYFYAQTDHSVNRNLAKFITDIGHEAHLIPINVNGDLNIDQLIENIKEKIPQSAWNPQQLFINILHVNNETGVIWPLPLLEKLVVLFNPHIHVDCSQSITRSEFPKVLAKYILSYTFCGHKFGALKGAGLSLLAKNVKIPPLLIGGNQESNLRSGTENTLGIYSLELAYQDAIKNYNFEKNLKATRFFEQQMYERYKNNIEIACEKATQRNSNTSMVLFLDKKKDVFLASLDRLGIEVSGGSACSSGMVESSKTLLALGYNNEKASSGIRFSFNPYWSLENMNEFWHYFQEKII